MKGLGFSLSTSRHFLSHGVKCIIGIQPNAVDVIGL